MTQINLIQKVKKLRNRYPRLFDILKKLARPLFVNGTYPRTLGKEVKAAQEVLLGSKWNMNYGKDLVHEKLEAEFATYVGTKYAIAVANGGTAIQIVLRALGLKPGDEVIHQVDTCVANPFAILNAYTLPVFADSDPLSFLLSKEDLKKRITARTKAVMPTHLWGNPDDMTGIGKIAKDNNLLVIEDCCLALGAKHDGKNVGSFGNAGVFSFGCLKPIQCGEGGMITTNDEQLAKECRTIRSWGEMSAEYNVRDQVTLSWNGRMSEISAAIVLEQLHNYENHLKTVRENVALFSEFLNHTPGLKPALPGGSIDSSSFTQVVLKLNDKELGLSKTELRERLSNAGVSSWHANFELLTSLSFFSKGHYQQWIKPLASDPAFIKANYEGIYPNASNTFSQWGIGLSKNHFLTKSAVNQLIEVFKKIL